MNTNNAAAVDLMVSSSRLYRLIDGTADLADEKVVKEGALTKQGAIHKTWKTRHFLLTGSGVCLYLKKASGMPMGGFILKKAPVLLSDNELIVKGNDFFFFFSPPSFFMFP